MSKASASTALDALATVLLGQGSSLFHSQYSSGTSQPTVPPPSVHGVRPPPAAAAAPSWHPAGHGMDHGRIARSLVQPVDGEHSSQHGSAADWLAVEGAWAAFTGRRPAGSSPPPPPSHQVAPDSVFDPWAVSSPAAPTSNTNHETGAESLAPEFEAVWSQSMSPSQDAASRIRPVGSRIDDVAEAVWESLTSTPTQPWSWSAEVNTSRNMPISAGEAQARAERGRARLGLLARQLAVVGGGEVDQGVGATAGGYGARGEETRRDGSEEQLESAGAGAGTRRRGTLVASGQQERLQQPAAM